MGAFEPLQELRTSTFWTQTTSHNLNQAGWSEANIRRRNIRRRKADAGTCPYSRVNPKQYARCMAQEDSPPHLYQPLHGNLMTVSESLEVNTEVYSPSTKCDLDPVGRCQPHAMERASMRNEPLDILDRST